MHADVRIVESRSPSGKLAKKFHQRFRNVGYPFGAQKISSEIVWKWYSYNHIDRSPKFTHFAHLSHVLAHVDLSFPSTWFPSQATTSHMQATRKPPGTWPRTITNVVFEIKKAQSFDLKRAECLQPEVFTLAPLFFAYGTRAWPEPRAMALVSRGQGSPELRRRRRGHSCEGGHAYPVAFSWRQGGAKRMEEPGDKSLTEVVYII